MRILKALIFLLSFGVVAGGAYAGEDTTYREHCTGMAFWEKGLVNFDPVKSECGSTQQAG
jgi:hypothetical protein